jgi:8-oxo-dGTP diphosphatase
MLNVTAAVITREDKILIAQRSKEDKLSLKWEFPGGKQEAGETPEVCLRREIMEELNLDIDVQNFLGSSIYKQDTREINLMAYKALIISGEIKLNVHNDIKWVSISDLKNYDFAPADVKLIGEIDFFNLLNN